MIGSFRWNLAFALFGFIVTLFVSLSHNIFMTSLVQSLFSAVLFFLIAFAVRWIFGTLVGMKEGEMMAGNDRTPKEIHKGQSFDMTTPDESEEIGQLLKPGGQASAEDAFSPLQPPKLASRQLPDSEELAQALRYMKDEEGGE